MTSKEYSWSYNEFLAYLLLYAASADFEITEEEKEVLFSKVNEEEYKHIVKDFNAVNDWDRLQAIISFREQYYNDEAAREKLFKDLKEMFLADEKYTNLERCVFIGLSRILRTQ